MAYPQCQGGAKQTGTGKKPDSKTKQATRVGFYGEVLIFSGSPVRDFINANPNGSGKPLGILIVGGNPIDRVWGCSAGEFNRWLGQTS
jgi:hypothetical protein